ncbi:MAG: flagellar basal body L-ring protein FlgH [Planctomycetes bacterium]|nr:flagellar basal body L-ring protein FlgH [Planctomycetota bacterium]
MRKQGCVLVVFLASTTLGQASWAQTSSLGAKKRQSEVGKVIPPPTRESQLVERNLVYEQYAWTASRPRLPKTYAPGDLITIIVRERRSFEAEADLERKRRWKIKSELDAFIDFTDGGIGASAFQRGKPNIEYRFDQQTKNEGDTSREDRYTTRLTGKIIDVKPNGLLVLEARARFAHDEEISRITFTGTCRKEDVTADNTILSTQVADKNVVIHNEGALRSIAARGWIPKLLDLLRPF